MNLNLWELQPFVVDCLKQSSFFKDHAQIILADDGTYPQTPKREEILTTTGLVLIVWQIESEGLADSTPSGIILPEIYVPVVIEENVKICRSSVGINIPFDRALQYVLQAVSGQPRTLPSNQRFLPMDPPFHNFGQVNGVQHLVVNFVYKPLILPSTP